MEKIFNVSIKGSKLSSIEESVKSLELSAQHHTYFAKDKSTVITFADVTERPRVVPYSNDLKSEFSVLLAETLCEVPPKSWEERVNWSMGVCERYNAEIKKLYLRSYSLGLFNRLTLANLFSTFNWYPSMTGDVMCESVDKRISKVLQFEPRLTYSKDDGFQFE